MRKSIRRSILKNYFIRRLAPFYGMALIIELVQKIWLIASFPRLFDFHPGVLLKTLLTAFIQTSVSFCYMALFLMLYFIAMPVQKQNKTFDQKVTVLIFYFFVFANFSEDFIEVTLFRQTQTSFTKDFLSQTIFSDGELSDILFVYVPLFVIVSVLSLIITKLWRSFLFPRVPAPVLKNRPLSFCTLLLLTIISYFFYRPDMSVLSNNPYNNELAKDGFYTIFKEMR